MLDLKEALKYEGGTHEQHDQFWSAVSGKYGEITSDLDSVRDNHVPV
jgi:hypothetical protein